MRIIIVGLALATAALAAGVARAADQSPPPVYKAPPPAATREWTGFYLGANVGYGSLDVGIAGIPVAERLLGVLAGGQVGYNWQINDWVLGVEFDGQWTDEAQTFGFLMKETDSISWFATGRGRIGYLPGPMGMIYVTGGGAWAQFNSRLMGLGVNTTSTSAHLAWVLGAGWEAAIDRHWSWKAEYLHFDTGWFNTNFFGIPTTFRLTDDVGRVGLNYRF